MALFFESLYGGVHFVGSQMRYGDVYLAHFVNRESWRGDLMRFGIKSREELIAAAMEIQNVPLDCCDDLRYLVEVLIFSWWGEGASPEEKKWLQMSTVIEVNDQSLFYYDGGLITQLRPDDRSQLSFLSTSGSACVRGL